MSKSYVKNVACLGSLSEFKVVYAIFEVNCVFMLNYEKTKLRTASI